VGAAYIPGGVLRGPPPCEVTPAAEADVYLAYGMPWAAVRCLRRALRAVGTLEEVDYGVFLDAAELKRQITQIEQRFPNWRGLEAEYFRARRTSSLWRFAGVLLLVAIALTAAQIRLG
jgi:hypothetical protein